MSFETVPASMLDYYTDRPEYSIVDLRDAQAYSEGHIKGAINIPYDELDMGLNRLPRNKIYVLYCERGGTSLLAARTMYRSGYDVLSINGGIHAWKGRLFV